MFDEKISALIDGELEASEVDGCVDRLVQDDAARQAWSRQHLLRAVLKEQATVDTPDFASLVMSAIDNEPLSDSVDVKKSGNVLKFQRPRISTTQWAAGLAMAASVAAVALLLPLGFDQLNPASSAQFASLNKSNQPVALKQRTQGNEAARREMQQYLLDHEALASGHGLNGQRGYMRMASPGTTYVAYSPK